MKGDYRTATSGGYEVLFEEALNTSIPDIFENAPARTIAITLTVRGAGAVTIAWRGGGQAGVTAGARGNDYSAGTYEDFIAQENLLLARAAYSGVTSGWITYWGTA